jgi:hypothetical protein
VQLGIAPGPARGGKALAGRDSETDEMLEAMGYVDEDKAPEDAPAAAAEAVCAPPAAGGTR